MPRQFRGPRSLMPLNRQRPAHRGRNLRRRCPVLLFAQRIPVGRNARSHVLRVDINIPPAVAAAIIRVDNIKARALSHRLQVSLQRVPLFRLALIF